MSSGPSPNSHCRVPQRPARRSDCATVEDRIFEKCSNLVCHTDRCRLAFKSSAVVMESPAVDRCLHLHNPFLMEAMMTEFLSPAVRSDQARSRAAKYSKGRRDFLAERPDAWLSRMPRTVTLVPVTSFANRLPLSRLLRDCVTEVGLVVLGLRVLHVL